MKIQMEFTDSEKCKSITHLKKESVELSLMRCGYEECSAGRVYGPHKKSYYMLYVVTEGRCVAEIDGRSYEMEKQNMVMVFPEQEFCFKAVDTDVWSCVWLGFAGMKADECAIYSGFTTQNPVLKIEYVEQIQKMVERIIETRDNSFGNLLLRNGLINLFFAQLIEYHDRKFLEEQLENVNDTEKSPHIRKAIAYITDNYASKIKINELADYVGVNRSYLASSFKKATGYSPKEYLLSLRMEKAKSLLEKTDMAIHAIASSVGYSDQLAFSRMFKEYSGMSPKAFREKSQQ